MINGKRVVRIVVGSRSDLTQMSRGLYLLKVALDLGLIDWDGVQIGSIHWNTLQIIDHARQLARKGVDFIIIGAGAANHLTGTCEAVIRRTDHNTTTHVLGVAFESSSHPEWNLTAIHSIIHVPATTVDFHDYNGPLGFEKACHDAVYGEFPEIIMPNQQKLMVFLPVNTAIEMAEEDN